MTLGIDGPSRRVAPLLWTLLGAFALRVLGQALVVFGGIGWLPPPDAWMSGVMAYPYLLPSQLLILVAAGTVCIDFTRGRGWFVRTRPGFRRGVLAAGGVYLAAMLARLLIFGWSIPVVFHFVLAAFLIVFALWHRGRRT